MPGIIAAIGIYYAFSRYRLVGTPVGLVLAHTCLAVPFVVTCVGASLAGFDRRLEQAALSLGATPWGTFLQVTLPLISPGVLVGALFAFITSFDELIVALFLSGSGAVTLPRRMWDDLRFAIDPTIASVSTLTIVLTAGASGLRASAPSPMTGLFQHQHLTLIIDQTRTGTASGNSGPTVQPIGVAPNAGDHVPDFPSPTFSEGSRTFHLKPSAVRQMDRFSLRAKIGSGNRAGLDQFHRPLKR